MNYKKIIIAGVVAGIVSVIFGTLTCGWLFKGVYQIEPTNIWKMTEETGFEAGTMVLLTVGSIVVGIVLAGVYAWIKNGIPGTGVKKGLCYGLIVWLVGTLPGMLATYAFMTVALAVVLYWLVIFLVKFLILGIVIERIYREG